MRDDQEWEQFRSLLVQAGTEVPEARSVLERRSVETAVDAAVSSWTAQRSPWEVTASCQERGIPAHR